jgi:gluconate 2-dehydrogenase gamma chain
MSQIPRRRALRLIGAAPLAVGFGVSAVDAAGASSHAAQAVKAAAKGKPYAPKFFTADEWQTVRMLVDMIIPRDERSGSATDAGVPEFMDFLMTDTTDDERWRESRRTAMRGGLAWIDAACRRRFGKRFAECADTERVALLDDIAYTKSDASDGLMHPSDARVRVAPGPAFFNSFRDLTASGFWSSQMGIEDLQYKGNTFVAEWTGPPPEVLAKLGLTED